MENNDGGQPTLSRRKFIQLGCTVTAGAALGYVAWQLGARPAEMQRSPEVELQPSILTLDFFNLDKFTDEYLRNNTPQRFSEEEFWRAMGVDDPSTKEGLFKANPENEEQARLLMLTLFKHQYENHGKNVVSVMDKTADRLGLGTEPLTRAQTSLASAVRFGKLEYDEIGNPTIHVSLSAEAVDDLVSKSPESIVNMSYELGDYPLTYTLYKKESKYPELERQNPTSATIEESTTYRDYQGNIITKDEYDEIFRKVNEREIKLREPQDRDISFMDCYAGEKTYDNVKMLTEIARTHPEKMFIAAGGNPTYFKGRKIPDIRAARLRLENEGLWQANLLIVGFQASSNSSGFVLPASYGADIYVSDKDLEGLNSFGTSSYVVPVITKITQQLVANGVNTHKRVKEAVMQMTQTADYYEGAEKKEYRLLNFDKAKSVLADTSHN